MTLKMLQNHALSVLERGVSSMHNFKVECFCIDVGEGLGALIEKLLWAIKLTTDYKILGCINGVYLECYKNSTEDELLAQYRKGCK